MSIEVDLTSVKRFWLRHKHEVRFVLDVAWGPYEPDEAELRDRAGALRDRLDQAGAPNRSRAEQWVHTDRGWAGVLLDVSSVDDFLEFLGQFVATWGNAVEGRVLGGPRSRLSGGPSRPQLTGYVAYSTADLTAIDRNYRSPLWFVGPATTRYVADRAITWAYFAGCTPAFDRPVEDVLTQARADFGAMILTRQAIVDHNPWRDAVLENGRIRPLEEWGKLAAPPRIKNAPL